MNSFKSFDHTDDAFVGEAETFHLFSRGFCRKSVTLATGLPIGTGAPTSADAMAARKSAVKRLRYFARSIPRQRGCWTTSSKLQKGQPV